MIAYDRAVVERLRLTFVRHGTTDANVTGLFLGQTDVALNEVGVREAAAVGARLAESEIDRLVTSDLRRARDTAAAIASRHAQPLALAIEPRLREIHLGELEGVPARTVRAEHPELMARWAASPADVRMPGDEGESLREVQGRAWAAVEELVATGDGQHVAVVSHTFTLLSVICRILELPLDAFRRLHIDRASISQVVWRRHGPVLIHFNDTSHLSG